MTTPYHRTLVRHLLSLGATIEVEDCDPSTKRAVIIDDLEASASSEMVVEIDGKREWALIIPGLDPDETIADFSCNGAIEEWFDHQP